MIRMYKMISCSVLDFQRDRGGESAGPGEYPIKGSVGKQPESQRVTLPAYSFPQSTRQGRDKVILYLLEDVW